MLEPDRQPQDRHDLAEALRTLRKAAGLSGERLAARCAMSQAKISRIERGKTLPTLTDVERILAALNAPAELVRKLVDLTRIATLGYKPMRAYAEMGLWRAQDEIKALIQSSTVVRQFLPAIPSGLLQTADYARQVLTPTVPGAVNGDTERALNARLAMQETLGDQSRRFVFLLTENALRWQRAALDVMAAQCRHMAEVSQRSNVDLAIIPHTAPVFASPLNLFVLYDERLVAVELFSGEVVLRDPKDITYHLGLFEFFLSHALRGDDATAYLHRVAGEFMPERE